MRQKQQSTIAYTNNNNNVSLFLKMMMKIFIIIQVINFTHGFSSIHQTKTTKTMLFSTTDVNNNNNKISELPDSLDDAAQIAAICTNNFYESSGPLSKCRVDFDTSIGDETYTTLKSSTEFMQKFLTNICYLMIPNCQQYKQKQIIEISNAKSKLIQLMNNVNNVDENNDNVENNDNDNDNDDDEDKLLTKEQKDEKDYLLKIINGEITEIEKWDGPKVRIYFPDAGSAALAKRDWVMQEDIPTFCIEFSSVGGVQSINDISNDMIVIYFCPRASESDDVEKLLLKYEETAANMVVEEENEEEDESMNNNNVELKLSIFVNPLLVDMGVTGFGMAGRLLRERLIDNLYTTYYLRTLPWGALTRRWPNTFSLWQESLEEEDGYKLIHYQNTLPSNPEVEDIYDLVNSGGDPNVEKKGLGILNSLGDFVNGMMKL